MIGLDAHCHFWTLGRGDYGWLDGTGGPLDPIRRDFVPEDMPGAHPVIAVQAAPTVAETTFLLGLETTRLRGVVGWVDLADRNVAGTLDRLASNPLMCGIRPMLQDIAQTDWLLDVVRYDALDRVRHLGLCFDALITQRHLPMMAQLGRIHPELPVIIDHAAKPPLASRDLQVWREGMKTLARFPQMRCKLSGLLTEMSAHQREAPLEVLRPVVDDLLEWFGPERLMWGSDWPVLTLAAAFDDWQTVSAELLAPLSATERAAIMGGTAAQLYKVQI